MPAPTITPLPTPPSRSQSPETFSTDADAFLGALPDFATEANAQATYLDGIASAADADAAAAVAAAAIAVSAANYKGEYNPATTYQIGDSVSYTGRRYAAKTVNTGVTPADGANWFLINDGDVLGPVSATNNGIALFDGTTGKLIKSGLDNGTLGALLASGGAGNIPAFLAQGASGQVLTSNGAGANPTFQSIGGTLNDTFTAAGAITAGKVVQFTTGSNVEEVTGTSTAFSNTLSAFANVGSVSNQGRSRIGISDDGTVAVALIVNSNTYQARVGTISGDTITWGTAVSLSMAGSTTTNAFWADVCFYPGSNTQFAIIGYDNTAATNNGYVCHFGTITGTTPSFTRVIILGGTQNPVLRAFVYASGSAVLITSSGTTLQGLAFTFSGTTITAGSVTTLVTGYQGIFGADVDKLSSNQILIAYCSSTTNTQFAVVRALASGTVVSAGTPATGLFGTNGINTGDICCDRRVANRFFVAAGTSGTAVTIRTGTVSGSSVSVNSSTVGNIQLSQYNPNGDSQFDSTTYLRLYCSPLGSGYPAKTRIVAIYDLYSATDLTWYIGRAIREPSDDTSAPSINNALTEATGRFRTGSNAKILKGALTANRFVYSAEAGNVSYDVSTGSLGLTYIVSNLTDAKIVGIASETVTNGQPVRVDLLAGLNKSQTGLTPQSIYYVDVTGALTTTSTAPNVKIGRANTATSIQMKALTI